MRNKILLVAAAVAAICVGATASEESENITRGAAYGAKVVTEKSLKTNGADRWRGTRHTDEIILNYYQYFSNKNRPGAVAINTEMVAPLDKNMPPAAAAGAPDQNVTVTGFCLINKDIYIGKQPASVAPVCRTNIGFVKMFANLITDNARASVFVDPIYIEKNGRRYKVLSSRVTNEARTSYNIATFVNDRKVAQIGLRTAENSANEIKIASNEYLKQIQKSRTETGVTYANTPAGGGGGNVVTYPVPVQTTKTQPPVASDYVTKAAINIAAETVKTAAQVFRSDLPYLYEIKKGTKVFIDLKVLDKEIK